MKRALVVEDHEWAREDIQDGLTEAGFEVVAVDNLDAARTAWNEQAFDFVVLDNNFPRSYRLPPQTLGMALAARLRLQAGDVPIVLWTGDSIAPLQAEADRLRVRLVEKGIGAVEKIVKMAKEIGR